MSWWNNSSARRGEIEIYRVTGSETYAVYFPFLVELDVECLLVEIPTENEVREIIANVRQRCQRTLSEAYVSSESDRV